MKTQKSIHEQSDRIETNLKLQSILENGILNNIKKPVRLFSGVVGGLGRAINNAATRANYAPTLETPGLSRMDKISPRSAGEAHTSATKGKENFHNHAINASINKFNTGNNDMSPEEKFELDRKLKTNKIG